MKVLMFFGFVCVAIVAGQQYLPPNEEAVKPENEYLPPAEEKVVQSKPSNQYLTPVEIAQGQLESDLAPIEAVEPIEQIAEDGYRYKTVKRIRYRIRRDVNELASAQYLPPTVEDSYGPPPSGPVNSPAEDQESAVLADDGYRYKTVRRIRYRHRRDVNELPSGQYLPPAQEDDSYSYPAPAPIAQSAPAPIQAAAPAPVEISAPAPSQQSAELADDGYRYKTVRRIRYRHRRDVNELASGQYLPPAQEDDSYSYPAPAPIAQSAPAPIQAAAPAPVEISAPAPSQQSAELADDGYRYKTVRRIRYRHRRDVNELASGQYLPPGQEDDSYSYPAPAPIAQSAPAPIQAAAPAPVEISAPAPSQQSAELADDGYRYKTVRRIRYRHRRDVNELASGQYLPPGQEDDSYSYPAPAPIAQSAPAPIQAAAPAPVEISAPAPSQQSAELADDGYRYKTVRRIRYRHRRDVNELASGQYLPPGQEDDSYSYPAPAPIAQSAPAPIQAAAPAPVEISAPAPSQQSAELADDGYRYKTVRRIRYRHRRDVNELASGQYLPPGQEDDSYSYPAPAPIEQSAPAPIQAAAPAPVQLPAPAPAPSQQSAELADDGYRYKTVRRIRYRHRRDVNELASGQYLPPAQEDDSYSYPAPAPIAQSAPAPIQAAAPAPVQLPAPAPAPSQQSAELADDGYRYKTIRRIRYRHRRDVNELASGQYLPPAQEEDGYSYPAPAPIAQSAPAPIQAAAPAPVEISAPAPSQQSAELADDGYRYKTVRRIRFRIRRDVNEPAFA